MASRRYAHRGYCCTLWRCIVCSWSLAFAVALLFFSQSDHYVKSHVVTTEHVTEEEEVVTTTEFVTTTTSFQQTGAEPTSPPAQPRRKSLSEQLWGNVPAKVNSNRRPSAIKAKAEADAAAAVAAATAALEGDDADEGDEGGAPRERRLSLQGERRHAAPTRRPWPRLRVLPGGHGLGGGVTFTAAAAGFVGDYGRRYSIGCVASQPPPPPPLRHRSRPPPCPPSPLARAAASPAARASGCPAAWTSPRTTR